MPNKSVKSPTELQREVQSLRDKLAAVTLKSGGKKKKKGPKPGPSSAGGFMASGGFRLSKSELLGSIVVPVADKKVIKYYGIVPAEIPWLKTLTSSFELVVWESVRFTYRPAVAMTQAGLVTIGVEYTDSDKHKPMDRPQTAALTPSTGGPVWKEHSVSVPKARLQARRAYPINPDVTGLTLNELYMPGYLAVAVEAASTADLTVGEVWINYTILLSGTRSA